MSSETVELATDCYIVASTHPTHSAQPPGNDAPELRLLGSAAWRSKAVKEFLVMGIIGSILGYTSLVESSQVSMDD